MSPASGPKPATLRKWRKYLANERAEAAVYRDLAKRRSGEEHEILEALADAEGRHEAHWLDLLGDKAGKPRHGDFRTLALGLLARAFGSIFVLALAQRAEGRSPYSEDADATGAMAADEQIHEEVVRGLAARGRNRLSGTFRAAVFGANDGLVSNLALVMGVGASGVSSTIILMTGISGLLAGALSMGAGEFVSVRSQRELLEASTPNPRTDQAIGYLDVDANELALVYRARGIPADEAETRAAEVLDDVRSVGHPAGDRSESDVPDAIGSAFGVAVSSFCFFASGAIIPVIPYLVGVSGYAAVIVAAILVGIALLMTGAVVGLLSGASPLKRALRQLGIGFGAAAATYILGLLFGTSVH